MKKTTTSFLLLMRNPKSVRAWLYYLLFFILLSIFGITNCSAQYTKLLDFAGASNGTKPYGNLIYDGTFLFGVTYQGGTNNFGTIFKIKPDGSSYTKLFDFAGTNGELPQGSLIFDGTYYYGMTEGGGNHGYGVIFKIKPDGSGFDTILNFNNNVNGGHPVGSLYYDGTFLYGMTPQGGASNYGIIFKILTNGGGFTKLLDFTGAANGSNPNGSLIYDGTFLYGNTATGGANFQGTIFKIKPDGSGYAKLLDFATATSGSQPQGDLYYDGTFLYGMAYMGGANNFGTIIKIKTDGSGYAKLYDFSGVTDGKYPYGSLIYDGTYLDGLTYLGGANNDGIIFHIKTDGSAFSDLHDFSGVTDGANSTGSLIFDGTFFYGMTTAGGTNNDGVVFKYNPVIAGLATNAITNGIKVFPNPTTTYLFIQSDEKIKSIKCMNYLGQTIEVKLENNSINVSALSNGLYFLNLTTVEGATLMENFIKD